MSKEEEHPLTRSEIEGRYANSLSIGFNALEFVLDFGQLYSEDAPVRAHTRIITSPAYAKSFSTLVRQALEDYEQKFGTIEAL